EGAGDVLAEENGGRVRLGGIEADEVVGHHRGRGVGRGGQETAALAGAVDTVGARAAGDAAEGEGAVAAGRSEPEDRGAGADNGGVEHGGGVGGAAPGREAAAARGVPAVAAVAAVVVWGPAAGPGVVARAAGGGREGVGVGQGRGPAGGGSAEGA